MKSNSVAGPIYRLERVFEEVLRGDFTNTVRFRDNDAYETIEGGANAAMARLNDEFARLASDMKSLKEMIVAGGTRGENDAGLEALLEKTKSVLRQINNLKI